MEAAKFTNVIASNGYIFLSVAVEKADELFNEF